MTSDKALFETGLVRYEISISFAGVIPGNEGPINRIKKVIPVIVVDKTKVKKIASRFSGIVGRQICFYGYNCSKLPSQCFFLFPSIYIPICTPWAGVGTYITSIGARDK